MQRYIEYKAEEYGIYVDDLKPRYTGQRCSHSECDLTPRQLTHGQAYDIRLEPPEKQPNNEVMRYI
ncbi:zinc ribbon domain-containing protein [Haloquadratum walsbyi]|uniref:zinc ribbon domain-containing protein n=1 Tax=Haloquadratum walsbyi TaxID=293091 RepID=UPI000981BEC7|nr:zinc ribbon domain-containing protein [Haloquadratum walsbyi]